MTQETPNVILLTIQMKTTYLFDFLYWHSYHGFYGVLNYGFSTAAIVLLACGFGKDNTAAVAALVFLALLFTVINPLLLYRKAVKQMKRTPMFQSPITYELSERELLVRQGDAKDAIAWENALLLRETKRNIVIYFGASNAVVLPKAEFEGQLGEVRELLKKAMPVFANKLKKR